MNDATICRRIPRQTEVRPQATARQTLMEKRLLTRPVPAGHESHSSEARAPAKSKQRPEISRTSPRPTMPSQLTEPTGGDISQRRGRRQCRRSNSIRHGPFTCRAPQFAGHPELARDDGRAGCEPARRSASILDRGFRLPIGARRVQQLEQKFRPVGPGFGTDRDPRLLPQPGVAAVLIQQNAYRLGRLDLHSE